MTELTQKILADWQIRKTKKQKTAFIEFLRGYYPDLRVEQGGMNRNLVIGDPETAKVIFTAHYDTCAVLPFPNFVTPKNFLLYLLYNILLIVPIFALAFGAGAGAFWLTKSLAALPLAASAVMFILLYLMLAGPANRHTVNDNTSGVVTLCELLDAMGEEERRQAAFVFFDNEELGLLGSARFRQMHKAAMQNKLLVNLDCVSDGDHILLVQSKRARKAFGEKLGQIFTPEGEKRVLLERSITAFYPSDQMNFPCSVGVAALNRSPILGYYLSRLHTPRDTVFDEKNIAYLTDRLIRLTREL